ncbi:DNA primase [Pelagibacterium luteolum]|uniref:DNA primase n=1 Tax=Pelagibacterium luteolum TaxID=440168 RepID=A0A1G7UMV6_9HYPH|nr:DNA primase [Pelagibacterium luteolum]SDG48834.1 DNA primase [Pelagibacterium luteolum]
MRFSDAFLDEIRNRLSITQVVGEHVLWDKRKSQPGKGDMWACCPFHGEKSPSFHADDRRGRYHCFGCGASGDHFRFLTEKTGMSFPEAVELLAGRAGVPMPERDEKAERKAEARRSLYDVMELATTYFIEALAHNVGARARGYLLERGVSGAMQQRFKIGFAPDSRNGLKEFLAANGVSAKEMADTGLVVHGEDIAVPYDRFRNRLMFPITDFRGRVIAFGGRALTADVAAKYLNSPETELFHKRQTLYNGQAARQAGYDGKPLIVVEGYLDVIAAVAGGFEGAVAPLGTALTEDHLNLLWRMTDIPVLCFDGDSAGMRAAERSIDIAMPMLKPGKSIRIVTLPGGLDPDDLIKQQGRQAFADLVAGGQSLADAVWSMETAGGIPEAPEQRAALEARLRERAGRIADVSVRRHYSQAFDEKISSLFISTRGQYQGRGKGGGYDSRRPTGGRGNPKMLVSDTLRNSRLLKGGSHPDLIPREAVIIMSLLNHPELAQSRLEALAQLELQSVTARQVLAVFLDLVAVQPDLGPNAVAEALIARGHGPAMDRMRTLLARHGLWQAEAESAQVDAETGLNHVLALHSKSVRLNRELKAAEMALGQDLSENAFERLRDIQNQISSVDGTEALIEGFGSLSGRATRSL